MYKNRILTLLLCALPILAACATVGRAAGEPGASLETLARASTPPTADPALASSVLVMLRNEDEQRYEIRFVDPGTGDVAPGSTPIVLGNSTFVPPDPLSADGSRLAAIESHGQSCEGSAGGTACQASADVLHLVDLQTQREVTATLPGAGWIGPLAFSPDAAHLALVQNKGKASILAVYDADTGTLVAQRDLEFRPSRLRHALDGTTLAVYGQPLGSPPGMGKPASPRVLLVDATTLDVIWEQPLEAIASGSWCLEMCSALHGEQLFTNLSPAVVPAHDGRLLYIVHADEARLTTVDFNAQTVRSVEIREAETWLERLLALTAHVAEAKGAVDGAIKKGSLAPDGKHLYVASHTTNTTRNAAGHWEEMETHLGLQVIDVENGRLVATRDLEVPGTWIAPDEIWLTPDGVNLVLNGWSDGAQWAEVFDADDLEPVTRLEGKVSIAHQVGGSSIIVASSRYDPGQEGLTEFAVLDPQSFDVIDSWTVEGYAAWVTP